MCIPPNTVNMQIFVTNTMSQHQADYLPTGYSQIPVSPWPKDPKQKERGLFFHALWAPDLEGYVQRTFGNVMGWTKEEMKIYIQHLRAELRNPDLHGQIIFRSVYAQKPLDA